MTALRAWASHDTIFVTDERKTLVASEPITSRRVGMLAWVDTLADMGYVQTSPWRGTNEEGPDGKAGQYCGVERAG